MGYILPWENYLEKNYSERKYFLEKRVYDREKMLKLRNVHEIIILRSNQKRLGKKLCKREKHSCMHIAGI